MVLGTDKLTMLIKGCKVWLRNVCVLMSWSPVVDAILGIWNLRKWDLAGEVVMSTWGICLVLCFCLLLLPGREICPHTMIIFIFHCSSNRASRLWNTASESCSCFSYLGEELLQPCCLCSGRSPHSRLLSRRQEGLFLLPWYLNSWCKKGLGRKKFPINY